jgi:aminomuconate-semialdehyde/2-hydroxymuconate-6-semialdehyde dehydrogenase
MQKIQNYIGGVFVDAISGGWINNVDPSRGQVYSQIPDSDEKDVELAVERAQQAFVQWGKSTKQYRSDILMRIASLIERDLDMLAMAESVDNGKPLWLAKEVDIPRASSNFKFFATGILHFDSQIHTMEGQAINYTLRHPLGVVGCISPWNLPLYLFTWKIAPALAAGNCVVAKPSEVTPMTAFMLARICEEAGLPPGVLNIVHGYGHKVGQAITAHKYIPAVSFTGGTVTGAAIAATAAPMFKKLSLELGGKNPNIVFDDANIDLAVKTSIRSSFLNQGQICLCGSRIFVQSSVYEEFKHKLLAEIEKINIGNPRNDANYLGAVVSQPHMEKILSKIEKAKELGGKVLCGGERFFPQEDEFKQGFYIKPTLIEGLDHLCEINQEEIFGPVATITPFNTEEEVILMANSTRYGLAASIWTENLHRAHRVSAAIKSGFVWVNTWNLRDLRTPFGGMKESGVGREGGFKSFDFFTEPQNVCVRIDGI